MKNVLFIIGCLLYLSSFTQTDKAIIESDTFYSRFNVLFQSRKSFKADLTNYYFPDNKENYTVLHHLPPVCQGNTGTCWCFAATSFFESEIYRLYQKEIKLSEMYFVYWEYIDRAIDFVRTRGQTYIDEGSEASALLRLLPKYGAVPLSFYKGKPEYRNQHSHRELVKQIKQFLKEVEKKQIWNESYVVQTVQSLLDKEMGRPPAQFTYEDKTYTPLSFAKDYLKLNPTTYFRWMSTNSVSYYEKHELVENDNWWHDDNYYNVPPDTFVKLIRTAVENGYSVCLCGDISEPGYDASEKKVAAIPTFDIPQSGINEHSRELRLQNESTTDDHCVHIVGCFKEGENYWYLIKDSNGSTFDGSFPGYRFYSDNYIKLKMMNILIHSDASRWMLERIIK